MGGGMPGGMGGGMPGNYIYLLMKGYMPKKVIEGDPKIVDFYCLSIIFVGHPVFESCGTVWVWHPLLKNL